MIHDPELIDQIQKLPTTSFDDSVFRATGMNADPTAFSTNGGRWAAPEIEDGGFSILYTSLEGKGAVAEVASYLALLTPVPRKPLKLHTLGVSVDKALKVAVSDFEALGIDVGTYSQRNYERAQRVGAAINFLELDGLIAPSARWECDNLMIFANRHSMDLKLALSESKDVPFDDWIKLAGSD
jgi:glycerophosphoryl diester phosphodiesterase